jgi:hypothetical protein
MAKKKVAPEAKKAAAKKPAAKKAAAKKGAGKAAKKHKVPTSASFSPSKDYLKPGRRRPLTGSPITQPP